MFSPYVSITMPFISKTNKTRRGRVTTRRNPRVVGNRVSIPTTTTGRVSVAKPMVSAVRSIARSVVKRETETKYVSLTNDQSFNSSISSGSEAYPLMPLISQGNDDFQRLGDKVRGKYLYVKGHLHYNASFIDAIGVNNYVPPSTCRILILSQKNIKSNLQINAGLVDTPHLLKDNVGTGVARAYVGVMRDNLAPINKDLFKVHMDRKVKMRYIFQSSDGTGTGSHIGQPTAYFACRIKMPATLTFDDTNMNNPNNFAPFLCFGSVLDDGSSPFSVQQPYRMTWLSTAYFEDA